MLLDGDKPSPSPPSELPPSFDAIVLRVAVGIVLALLVLTSVVAYITLPAGYFRHFPGMRSYRVEPDSMAPTLRHGDVVLASLLAYDQQAPQRGDIVVFIAPLPNAPQFNKRIVGIGGDEIVVTPKGVILNGHPVSEPYLFHASGDAEAQGARSNTASTFGPIKVPPGQYFLLGDNRDDSYDSRYWGSVTRDKIIGKVISVMHADDPTHQWRPVK